MQKLFITFIILFCLGNIWGCQTTSKETKMPETKSGVGNPVADKPNTQNLNYKITEADDHTFGYEISANGSVLVRQPFIPAVAGKQGFVSKEEAEIVAKLILQKVEHNIIPPAISVRELDSLQIHYHK